MQPNYIEISISICDVNWNMLFILFSIFTFKAIEAMRTQFLESVYNLCKKFFHIT